MLAEAQLNSPLRAGPQHHADHIKGLRDRVRLQEARQLGKFLAWRGDEQDASHFLGCPSASRVCQYSQSSRTAGC